MTQTRRGSYASPRQAERRRRILRAARSHLTTHGLQALSMNTIAELSQVSVKTLYNIFGSKDLLLLEAAAEVLADLSESEAVMRAEAGLPRLLAYTVGSMVNFTEAPAYARAVISTLVRADFEPKLADGHMGVVRRYAENSLSIAADQQELRSGADIKRLAQQISANQWGAVLLWEKGLLDLERLPNHIALSHYMTLTPICIGDRRESMQQEFEKLLIDSKTIKRP